MRIGIDIDDCLADFIGAYKKYFDTDNNPDLLQDHKITWNVQNILRKDRDFWINLPVKNTLNFVPELYCTKRINPKAWTKLWLKLNGFPDRPVYQMYNQNGNKADMIKGRVDVFIDDSFNNVLKCNKSGVPALLYHTESNQNNPMYKIYSLDINEIIDTYCFLKTYGYQQGKT